MHQKSKIVADLKEKMAGMNTEQALLVEQIIDFANDANLADEEVYALRVTGLIGGSVREKLKLMKDGAEIPVPPLSEKDQKRWDDALAKFHDDPPTAMSWMAFHERNHHAVRG